MPEQKEDEPPDRRKLSRFLDRALVERSIRQSVASKRPMVSSKIDLNKGVESWNSDVIEEAEKLLKILEHELDEMHRDGTKTKLEKLPEAIERILEMKGGERVVRVLSEHRGLRRAFAEDPVEFLNAIEDPEEVEEIASEWKQEAA